MSIPDARVSSLLHVTISSSLYRVSRNCDFQCNNSFVCRNPEMPNPDSFRSSDTRPSNRMAPTVSGNRGSRFHCARVSRLRKLRYPELRLSGISRHASSPMDGSKLPSGYRGSRLQHASVLCPRKPRYPDFAM
jgi:hypothetical protein